MNTKILASLLVIGAVGAVAGSATFAEFSDTETSEDNVFTAGAIDLKLDWQESYNGEPVEAYPDENGDDRQDDIQSRDEIANDQYGKDYDELEPANQEDVENQYRSQFTEAEPIFQLDDVKPGDTGEATISTHVFDNPAWLWMRMSVDNSDDNGLTEPEDEVDETGSEGELDENIIFTVWNDDEDNVWEPCTDTADTYYNPEVGDSASCTEERTDSDNANGEQLIYYGPADEFGQEDNHYYVASNEDESDQTLGDGALVDGEAFGNDGFQPHPNSTTNYVGVKWHLPFETGNVVQTDSMELTMDFYAQQYRHNDVNPSNPWTDQEADVGQNPSPQQ